MSEYLKKPKQQLFYHVLATLMSLLTLADQRWWGYSHPRFRKIFKFNNFLVYICAPCLLFLQIAYFYKNCDELTFNIRSIIMAITPVTALVNMCIVSSHQPSYVKVMKELMGKIHLSNLVQNSFVKKKIIQIERKTRYVCYFFAFFLMLDWLAWTFITSLNNYRNWDLIQNKTMRFETTIFIVLPFDYKYNLWNWLLIHVLNVYFVWSGCVIIILHNSVNYVFIFQLIGHIEILKHRLKTEFNGEFEQEEIREKLVDVIKYHSFVLSIFRDIQSAFASNVTSFYFYNLLADSLLLYQIMAGDKRNIMMYLFMITAYVGGLIVMSFVLEEVRRQTIDLATLVYCLPWENMSVSNRKMVLLFMMRAQPALEFIAAGGLKAGVKPMLSILKSSFSYYVMLKSSISK